jgi:hypothetical protein
VGPVSARSFVHPGIGRISLVNLRSGGLLVEPGPTADAVEGTVSATDDRALISVAVRQDHDHLIIMPGPRRGPSTDVHVRLGVPAGLDYNVSTGSADVNISVEAGATRVISGSGDISLEGTRDLHATTGSGNISTGPVTGMGAMLSTGSGDIVMALARCPVQARSGSGDVLIRRLEGAPLRARSGSGDISVPFTSGSVDLRSGSGALTVGVAEGLLTWLDLHSLTGEIRIALEAADSPTSGEHYVSVRGRTASGAIAVYRA